MHSRVKLSDLAKNHRTLKLSNFRSSPIWLGRLYNICLQIWHWTFVFLTIFVLSYALLYRRTWRHIEAAIITIQKLQSFFKSISEKFIFNIKHLLLLHGVCQSTMHVIYDIYNIWHLTYISFNMGVNRSVRNSGMQPTILDILENCF